MRPLRFRLLSLAALFAAAFTAASGLRAAESAAPVAAPAAASAAEDPWLVSLSALLAERYRAAGELRLAWHRPLPATAPRDADLEIVSAPAALAPQLLVTVRARAVSGAVADFPLILRAELWRDGLRSRQPVSVGAPLDPSALEAIPVDVLRERDALVLDAAPGEPAPDLNFARAVPAGRVLVWRDVLRRPLVRRGQPVDVVATDGALTVSLRAFALHDAARGESVRVRNPDSQREFVATVVSESRASVRF